MRRWLKRIGLTLLALVLLVVALLPFVVGIRPIIGPRARALTDRTFEATPERLERGRYLANNVSGCLACHSEIDWPTGNFVVKDRHGRERSIVGGRRPAVPHRAQHHSRPRDRCGHVDRRHAGARDPRGHRARRPDALSGDAVPPVPVHGGRGSGVDHRVYPVAAAGSKADAAIRDSVPREPVHQRRARTGHRARSAARQEQQSRVRRLPGAHRRLPRLSHAGECRRTGGPRHGARRQASC